MTWYTETDNHDLPLADRSLSVAFANLLSRYNYGLSPRIVLNMLTQDDPTIDWWSFPRSFMDFTFDEFSEGSSWPPTNMAIIKQQRISEEAAGYIDHYSLVADQRAQSIIDSFDGKIKSATEYGPIIAWASYTYTAPTELATKPAEPAEPEGPDDMHILKPGENIWDVARQHNIPVATLIGENEIEDPRHLPAGTEIYLPPPPSGKDTPQIRYELLNPPIKMHVSRESGAKKWSFGDVTRWEDIASTGRHYPQDSNVTIVAIAHVPIGSDTAAYYMDSLSLGDYDMTGRPRYTTGFNWQHLGEGHSDKAEPETVSVEVPIEVVEQVVADALQEDDRPAIRLEVKAPSDETDTETNVPELVVKPAQATWKNTFTFLNPDKRSEEYVFKESALIHELEGRLPDKQVGKFDSVRLIGTFHKDGIFYGRAAVNGYWYGIPMNLLDSEDEVYNSEVDLPTKVAMRGHLTRSERRLVMLAKTVARYRKLVGLVKINK